MARMPHALELYGQWFRRELSQRFAGAALGPLWLLLQPLSFIVVITLVFNGFFKTKWPGGDGSALDYGLKVFVGLAVHTFAADVLARSPSAITAHAYLVTKVRFPLPLLPLVGLGVAACQLVLSLFLAMVLSWGLGMVSAVQVLHSWWAMPLVLLPSALLLAGLSWFLSATGTYLRDLGNLMPAIVSLLMFLMPVFYPAELVPPSLAWLVQANPVAFGIEAARALIFAGELPSWSAWASHTAASGLIMAAGAWYFQRVRPGFADVL